MPAAGRDGAAIYYESHGAGPPILFSAGMGGSGGFWAPQVEELSRTHQVILYDHVGTGRSGRGAAPRDLAGMADDMAAVLDALGLESAHLVGHAIGGIVGAEFALRHPARTRSLTVVNGWARADDYLRRCFEVRQGILASQGPRAYVRAQPIFLFPPQWIAEHTAHLEEDEAKILAHFPGAELMNQRIGMFLGFDGRATLGAIRAPTLIAISQDDALVPAYLGRALAALIPGAVVREVAHGAHAFTTVTPGVFNAMLREFLDTI